MNNAKEYRRTLEQERLENWRYQGNISYKDVHDQGQKQCGLNRSRRD